MILNGLAPKMAFVMLAPLRSSYGFGIIRFHSNSRVSNLLQATTSEISFDASSVEDNPKAIVMIGKKHVLKEMALQIESPNNFDEVVIDAMLETGSTSTTFLPSGTKISLCQLPDTISRNNHPLSVHKITQFVASSCAKNGTTHIKVGGVDYPGPIASAVAKSFPLYNRKTDTGSERQNLILTCVDEKLKELEPCPSQDAVAQGVRLACRLMDSTPEELTTAAFSDECRKIVEEFKDTVTMTEIVGEDLARKGYGGIYGVGKAAQCPPRLVVMEYTPTTSSSSKEETIALVGKGILYDTGGLSLKPKDGMSGMKHDMGGAAGLLGAFLAAVKLNVNQRLKLILCVAENAIGPTAFRNDDILTLYSGKTVEVNNCDAEGRLVLGDGVAHATKHFDCDLVIDMATLTGAQLVATGKKHAGVLANTLELEQRAMTAGLLSGDLVYPLLYAPELLEDEFESKVADMRNSVKDRMNAQTSCAGHFIESHLDKDYDGGWLHVDMAGPGSNDQRGTGYGVGLILSLLEAPGFRRSPP